LRPIRPAQNGDAAKTRRRKVMIPNMAYSDTETKKAFGSAFKTFPTLDTQRLILSEIVPEEAHEYHCQQRSALDMPNRPPWALGYEAQSVDYARRSLSYSQTAWKKKQSLRFGIRLKPEFQGAFQAQRAAGQEGPLLVGTCMLFDFQGQCMAEMGYWLGADYHNHGIMTEAVRAVVTFVFGTMRMNRIYAYTSLKNLPSIAVLRKAGFVQEGVLRQNACRDGRWDDSALMAIIGDDLR
jgi:ribosomal-protein-alanine N-acetyltransferase